MKRKMNTEIEKMLQGIETVILGIKASGGYKYRQQIRASDMEIQRIVENAENYLRFLAISLVAAEEIIQEPEYWTGKNRWEGYSRRRAAIIRELAEEKRRRK